MIELLDVVINMDLIEIITHRAASPKPELFMFHFSFSGFEFYSSQCSKSATHIMVGVHNVQILFYTYT